MTEGFGLFPFGRPNTIRPARMPAGDASVMVVGVYPSAWHVRWSAPKALARTEPGTTGVAALAVDVEPEVFWNGDGADFTSRLVDWTRATGFVPGDGDGEHGTIAVKPPASNGSSGATVEARYLSPLGVQADHAAFTDVCPIFFVKRSSGARREQGDAIRAAYDPIAERLGFPPCTLPSRPAPARLVNRAATEFADPLLTDLRDSGASMIVTLGAESLQTMRSIPDLHAEPPAASLGDIYDHGLYGRPGRLRIGGKTVDWLALVHPGLLKGRPAERNTAPSRDVTPRGRDWNGAHLAWEQAQQRTRADNDA